MAKSERINVPVEAIERIEVVRGPNSVIYGNGAFLGAINIITHDCSSEEVSNIVSATVGNYGTQRYVARLSGQDDNFKYNFIASYYTTNGINEPMHKFTSNSDYLSESGSSLEAKTEKMLRDNRKYFNFSSSFKNLRFELAYLESQKGIFDGQPSVGDGSISGVGVSTINLVYKKQLSENILLS